MTRIPNEGYCFVYKIVLSKSKLLVHFLKSLIAYLQGKTNKK